ncbi:MAG TPA: hypothetical protein VL286_08405 [Rhizomicrobium sp.]|jgi:hypothetical protein|nr:hypothetical protein [Rhizomicrobium sp.]
MDRDGKQFADGPKRSGAESTAKPKVRFGRFEIPLPNRPFLRILLGTLLVIGGLLWFLPLLGLWMLPLGLIVLSVDIALIRRLRRRGTAWWARRAQAHK